MKEDFKKAEKVLMNSKRVAVVGHQKHDADSLASILTMTDWLKKQNKFTLSVVHEDINEQYFFLPTINRLQKKEKLSFDENFDCLLVVDASDLKYAGLEQLSQQQQKPLIVNIDHHFSNEMFGDVNLVNSKASSTTEIIFDFLQSINYKINHQLATLLMAGIAADTENFYNDATSAEAVAKAAKLLSLGADLALIIKKIFKTKKINELKTLGLLLDGFVFNENLKTLSLPISQKSLTRIGIDEAMMNSNGVSNILKNVEEAEMVVVLKETADGKIKGSLRSKKINVEKLARFLGGGGHKKAAGFMIDGHLIETENGWQVV